MVELVRCRTPDGLVAMQNAGWHDNHAIFLQEILVDQGILLHDACGNACAVEAKNLLPRRDKGWTGRPDLGEINSTDSVRGPLHKLQGLALAIFEDDRVGQDLP